MQVQYYSPSGGHLLYHYAAALPSSPSQPSPQHLMPPPPPPPQLPHPYFAFPLILQQQQQQQRQQQQTAGSSAAAVAAASAAAAAAFFAQQQQQQLAGLALHFQSLSIGGRPQSNHAVQGRSGSAGSNCSNNDAERVRSQSSIAFDPADYQWKLLVWLKTHRMHKYFDRLRKYSFDQLVNLDRDTLESEQFTQGAIKKLLGMLDRVRADRSAFESPSRAPGAAAAAAAGAGGSASLSGTRRLMQQQNSLLRQQLQPVFPPTLTQPPPPPPPQLPPYHPPYRARGFINNYPRQQQFLCSQH